MARPQRKSALEATKRIQSLPDHQDDEGNSLQNVDVMQNVDAEYAAEKRRGKMPARNSLNAESSAKKKARIAEKKDENCVDQEEDTVTMDQLIQWPTKFSSIAEFQRSEAENSPFNWWWEFAHEKYPELQPEEDFNCIQLATVQLANSGLFTEREAVYPCEVVYTCEKKLSVEGPDEHRYRGHMNSWTVMKTRRYAHPDPALRFSESLSVEDFPEPEDLIQYRAELLRLEKERVISQPDLAGTEKKHKLTKKIDRIYSYNVKDSTGKLFPYCGFPAHYEELTGPNRRYFVRAPEKLAGNGTAVSVDVFINVREFREYAERDPKAFMPFHSSFPRYLEIVAGTDKFTIPDTMGTPEAETPLGFQLELRSYQKRTLTWLLKLEHDEKRQFCVSNCNSYSAYLGAHLLQLGPGGVYWDSRFPHDVFAHLNRQRNQEQTFIPCNGGILADDTGTGKTVTALALIQACPFESVECGLKNTFDLDHGFLPSRATLIVCPSHLAEQWRMEAKRCLPDTAKIVVITTILDFRKMTWNDFLLSDIIITSLNFLQNQSYAKYLKGLNLHSEADFSRAIRNLRMKGRHVFGNTAENIIFSRIYWHRVICDEFHELGASSLVKQASDFFLKSIESRFFLGITGTPFYSNTTDIGKMAKYLNTTLPGGREACHLFLSKAVRRNEPNLQLPPLIEKHIFIDLSIQERGLYLTLEDKDALMACNHHHLADGILDLVSDHQEMNIQQVSDAVQNGRIRKIQSLEQKCEKSLLQFRKIQDKLFELTGHNMPIIIPNREKVPSSEKTPKEREVDHLNSRYFTVESEIKSLNSEITTLHSQYNFFKHVLDSLDREENSSCIICLENIVQFSITRCGHVYCVACAELLMSNTAPSCSMCRSPLTKKDLMRINREVKVEESNDDANQNVVDNNLSKYGSKLASFVAFMRETLKETAESKFILFIQFKRLMRLVSQALTEFEINHVQCTGNVMSKSRAVRLFKESEDTRLILLSSDDSVSGLHLTNATHMVIFHPFHGEDEVAVAYEKQGIARAWRSGLDHPVSLIRFIVRDSIEEDMALKRRYQEGSRVSW